jgi:hypothetical protein
MFTFLMLLFSLSCKKDKETIESSLCNVSASDREGEIDPMTTNKVHVVNGMLKFDDFSSF